MDPQRHPILGRLSGEAVLGEVWPVEGRRLVIAQQSDARQMLLPPQSGPRQSPQRRHRRSRFLPERCPYCRVALALVWPRFLCTMILLPRCSTDQPTIGHKAGAHGGIAGIIWVIEAIGCCRRKAGRMLRRLADRER